MVEEPQTTSSLSQNDAFFQSDAAISRDVNAEDTSPDARLAQLFIEDFVVTTLLRTGRAQSHTELNAAAENLTLGRTALKRALQSSTRILVDEHDYELRMRAQSQSESRQERARRPLEATIDTLLFEIGKPLPLPVIAREVANLRSVLPEAVRDGVAHTLQTSRAATQTAPNTFLHTHYLLKMGAPNEELLIRENDLKNDPDFARFSEIEYSNDGTLGERAVAILDQIAKPISLRLLGFLLQRQSEKGFRLPEMAQILGDRATFYAFVGGFVSTQNQMPNLRARTQNWLNNLSGGAAHVDLPTLLRTRLSPDQIIVPTNEELTEVARQARSVKAPISVVSILTDTLEIEPDDAAFLGTLQGLNDALRRDTAWLPAGLGNFLLRESVPEGVGKTPEGLRPIHLLIRDTETHEPLDIELSDDGLEGDGAAFIHDAQWEEIGEEVEVKMARRAEEVSSTRYVVTYPHFREGTMKLRRMDEDFFALESAVARLAIRATDDAGTEEIAAWASRDSGLILGLGDWYKARAPQSGAVLEFSRDANKRFTLQLGKPDKLMFLEDERVTELEGLQERSRYVSLFDLLQTGMGAHSGGAEIPTLWAEINVVRRTSKRLLCSVLSAYQCFSFKQRGPQQFLWRFDAGKVDGGFKKNKRKFVRR